MREAASDRPTVRCSGGRMQYGSDRFGQTHRKVMVRNSRATVMLDQPLGPIREQLIGRLHGRAHRADDSAEDTWVIVALIGNQDQCKRIG
jgi:hypothetical protein